MLATLARHALLRSGANSVAATPALGGSIVATEALVNMADYPINATLEIILLALQAFQVLFLWAHDWVPLGRLNDVAAVRSQDSLRRLVIVTLVQSVPWSIGLAGSLCYFRVPYPAWLQHWLWDSYLILLCGEFYAWWLPYLFRADPPRAARYRIMFGQTHAFLPQRNGMAPNTLHVALHSATLITMVLLIYLFGLI